MSESLSEVFVKVLEATYKLDDSKEDQEIYEVLVECMDHVLTALEEHVGGEQDVR